MKKTKTTLAIFVFALFLLGCDDGHHSFYNKQGLLQQESFKLKNGFDSIVYYGWYADKRKRSVSYSLERFKRPVYDDAITYDSATGKRIEEVLLNGQAWRVRTWSEGYDKQFDRIVISNHYAADDNADEMFRIDSCNNKLFLVYYESPHNRIEETHEYDADGKIIRVSIGNYPSGIDTVIFYKTPEEKNAFRDSLLLRAEKLKKPFPSGN